MSEVRVFRVVLSFPHGFHSGADSEPFVQHPLLLDRRGGPMLRGSSIKGIFRRTVETLAPDRRVIDGLLGREVDRSDRDERFSIGKLTFLDASVDEAQRSAGSSSRSATARAGCPTPWPWIAPGGCSPGSKPLRRASAWSP